MGRMLLIVDPERVVGWNGGGGNFFSMGDLGVDS